MFLVLFLLLSLSLAVPAATAQQGKGTYYMVEQDKLGQRLTDDELDKVRGGFLGMAFGVYFTGFWDNVGALEGNLLVNASVGENAIIPPPDINQTNNAVQIQTVIGGFEGAHGIFQISSVPGSFNIVNNNLFVQIAIVNVLNSAQVPNLSSLLGF